LIKKITTRTLALACTLILLFPVGTARAAQPAASVPAGIGGFQQVAPGAGWLLLDGRLFWTADDGASWKDVTPAQGGIQAVTFIDGSSGRLIVADGEAPSLSYTLAYTADGGESWGSKALALPGLDALPAPVTSIFMGWRDPQQGWLVFKLATGSNFSLGMLFVTADGGDTWAARSIPLGEPAYFVTEALGWVAGGPAGDQLYRTQDGGATWQRQEIVPVPAHYGLPVFDNESRGLLPLVSVEGEALSAEFYATEDGGASWTQAGRVALEPETPPGVAPPLAIPDASGFLLAVPRSSRLARLENGQLSERSNTDGLAAGLVELSMSSLDSGWGKWASGACTATESGLNCSQEIRLLRTSDGGEHWQPIGLPGQVSLEESFSLADKNAALEAGSASGLDADTQPYVGHGFDLCSIPALSQMQTWWNGSPYNAVNLYIGGSARACANTILSASYLSQLNAQGWRFIPTWVGPQASCSYFSSRMSSNAATAYAQGVAQADQALTVAAGLGLTEPDKSGTIIYYDLEAYDTSNTACRNAADSFVSGWVAEMHAYGNQGGMYGASCGSVPTDWASIANPPDALWVANWYGNAGTVSYRNTASVWGAYCLSDSLWGNHQRLRQYAGDHSETWAGLTLGIDSNVLDGPLTVPNGTGGTSLPGTPSNPGPAQAATLERGNNTWLTWKTNGDTCSVHVWGGVIDLTSASACSQFKLGVRSGGAYSWQVTAFNAAGSTAGPVWHFSIKPYGPGTLTAVSASSTKVNLAWQLSSDDPASLDGYYLYADGQRVGSTANGVSSYQVANLACKVTHTFYATAVRQGVESNPGNTATALTPSCAPVATSPSDGTILQNRRPTFEWQALPDATSYTVQVSPYANFSGLAINASLSATSYTAGVDLAANTLFYWRVRAGGPFGYSDWSPVMRFTTANPPSVPVQLAPAANGLVTDTTPRLDWQDVTIPANTAFDHYQVQVSAAIDFSTLLYDEASTVSEYTLPVDLPSNSKFYWQVRAYNTLGQASAWSLKRPFRTAILPPDLGMPLQGEVPASLRPTFDWADVQGASGYTLQISRYQNFSTLLRWASPAASSFTLPADLPANSVLFWRVQAAGANGPSLWSQVWSFTSASPPAVPALIWPLNGALSMDYTPRLDWTTVIVPAGTEFDHYQLQVATDSVFASILLDQAIADLSGSEFSPAGDLPSNSRYYWHVRAFNKAGQYSSWSASWSFRTAILPPVLLFPSQGEALLNRRPTLDWENAAGASGYRVQASLYSNFSAVFLDSSTASSTLTPAADLPAGALVFWRVKATGPNGPSYWSEIRSFTTATPPGIPVLVSPINGSLTTSYTPRFDWGASSVTSGAALDHYQLQVASDSAFATVVLDADVSAPASDYIPALSLPANAKLFWHVRAFNLAGQYSSWSATWSLRTALTPPALLAPADGALPAELRPRLDWDDVAGAASYTVQISLYPNFSAILLGANTSVSGYTPGFNLPRGVTIYWRVRTNGTNGPSLWSEVWDFVIQ
jgi:hypothetical protein